MEKKNITNEEFEQMLDKKIAEKQKKENIINESPATERTNQELTIQEGIESKEDINESNKNLVEVNNSLEDYKVSENVEPYDNMIIEAWSQNKIAIETAKAAYEDVNKQKKIGKKIEKVVEKKTNADIGAASVAVDEQNKDTKIKKQKIKNELFKLHKDKIFLRREQKHRLKMQKFKQRKEKYGDLMLKYCRRKQKDEQGKYVYLKDKDGNDIINYPNAFTLFFLLLFDTIVMTLNQVVEVLSTTNKVIWKGFFVIIFVLIFFVEPIRNAVLGWIGIKL